MGVDIRRTVFLTASLIALLLPHRADAQWMVEPSGLTCIAYDVDDHCAAVQPLWIGDPIPDEGPLTLEKLAEVAAPILWLSQREFLLLEGKPYQAPGVIRNKIGGQRAVYYRVRTIRLKKPSSGASRLDSHDPRIRTVDAIWSDDNEQGHLPIDELERVYITYFFYYSEDRGVGGHPHDVEALEVQIKLRRACRVAFETVYGEIKPKRTEQDHCWPAAELESTSGSAHGVGWYTNTLRLSATRDTVLPLVALVEENKHATAPDRDADGRYMPHYDVNRHSNDAWGIRDVAGTGSFGATTFRAEGSRQRTPDTQVCPPSPSPRLVRHYRPAGPAPSADDPRAGCLRSKESVYQLLLSTLDPVCGDLDNLKHSGVKSDRHLYDLLTDKHFCESEMTVTGPRPALSKRTLLWLGHISPGPDGQYGFQNALQRMSFAYRYDRGQGVAAVVPIGHELPYFGGWAVLKVNAVAETLSDPLPLSMWVVEAMYSPSASRPFDWYVTVGAEGSQPAWADARSWHVAEEIGVKIRFSAEWLPVVRFLGGRMGIRASSLKDPRDVRFVYEFGAGSW